MISSNTQHEAPSARGAVFIIEDDHATSNAVTALFRPKGYSVRCYDSAESFLQEFQPSGPSCLLVDQRLPGMNGSELLKRLALDGVNTPAVMVTAFPSTPTTVEAMRHGAVNVLEKPCSDTSLEQAITSALAKDQERMQRERPIQEAKERLSNLSNSEREVLKLVLLGTPNKQIAKRLGVCVRTIESRRSKIYQAARVNSVAELVRLCVTAGATGE